MNVLEIIVIMGVFLGLCALFYLHKYNQTAREYESFSESVTKRIEFLKREYVKVFEENQKLHQTNGILQQQNKVLETQIDILRGDANEKVS
jgi:hypothetical protein